MSVLVTTPLRVAAIEIDGTVTRTVRFDRAPGEMLLSALREAMLKRGCLRDREHKGACMACALLPECSVWPLVAPADPTRRQSGTYLRPFVLRLPDIPAVDLPPGTQITYGVTCVQDYAFPALWGEFAGAVVRAARQIAEWGIGVPIPDQNSEGPARRGTIAVSRVRWVNPASGETQPLVLPESEKLSPQLVYGGGVIGIEPPASIASGRLSLSFVTPTRIVVAGKTQSRPEPVVLVRRILERLEHVAAVAGAAFPYAIQPDDALAAAARLQMQSVAVHTVGNEVRGGFVGSVVFIGAPDDLQTVLRVLRWGQVLGVGKGTPQGAGRIAIEGTPPTARVLVEHTPRPVPSRTPPRRLAKPRGQQRRG